MKVLKICTGTWENASRDQRELGVCQELGMESVVLAKGKTEDRGRKDTVNGFQVLRFTTRPYNRIPVPINRVISIFQWAKYASTLNADIISGHDIEGWTIGWLSKFFNRKKKPLFVYDSHEFELGRNAKRNKIQLAIIKFWEKKVIKDSAFTIVVNDSIANELVNLYKLKESPVVVRNIPNKWDIDSAVCAETRKKLEEMFGGRQPELLQSDVQDFIVMYHGAVVPGRDVERLIELVSINKHIKAVILGNAEDSYKRCLEEQIDRFGVCDRVAFHPAVPLKDLWKYVGAADVGMILARATCKNHLFSLPNKFFENIQAGTQVICPDYPAFRQVIEKYKNGLTCNPEDMNDINRCVEQLRTNKELYEELKRNTMCARDVLNWEAEKERLVHAYHSVLNV